MKNTLIVFLGFAGLTACASIDEMKTNVISELSPKVTPLVKQCERALIGIGANISTLTGMGLEKVTDSNGDEAYDNGLPEKSKGTIKGTGLYFKHDRGNNECLIAVGPDGFPNTISSIIGAELVNLGFVADQKSKNYIKNGKTVALSTQRAGNQISYFTTTASLKLK